MRELMIAINSGEHFRIAYSTGIDEIIGVLNTYSGRFYSFNRLIQPDGKISNTTITLNISSIEYIRDCGEIRKED